MAAFVLLLGVYGFSSMREVESVRIASTLR